ncbi:hypothetical protein ACSNNV_16520, partial [Faecalibacterium prausnitzii]|uniref:hypothetical protein n=1 Tax=Faecalibacterium prausnitzii TaxID=853 RepID=UPI003F196D10
MIEKILAFKVSRSFDLLLIRAVGIQARGVTLSIQFYAAISQHSHFNTGQVGLSVGEPSYFHRILVG